MKKIFLSLFLVISILNLKAQSFELSVQANTGMSRYTGGGQSATATNLNVSEPYDHSGYPNALGGKFAANYGFGVQGQYVFKVNFILGLQVGYETISNDVTINGVYDGATTETPATGYARQHLGYFNFNPYIGYRFNINKVKLDIMPGVDIASGVHTTETVNVKASDGTYYNKPVDNYGSPFNDFRLRIGAAAYYKKFGVTASYSKGKNLTPGPSNALGEYTAILPDHVDVFRLGLSYQLK